MGSMFTPQAEALRRKADWLELHGDELRDLIDAGKYETGDFAWALYRGDLAERLGQVVRFTRTHTSGATWGKTEADSYRGCYLDFGSGVKLRFEAHRDAVCELVEVGTKTVDITETTVVGTEEVPDYEYRCPPLLELAAEATS